MNLKYYCIINKNQESLFVSNYLYSPKPNEYIKLYKNNIIIEYTWIQQCPYTNQYTTHLASTWLIRNQIM